MLLALATIVFQQQTESGLSLRLYQVDRSLQEVSTLVPGQTPNVDRLMPSIDLKSGDFFGFNDNFVVEVTGEFNAKQAGDYSFRVSSDDGSEVLVDGKRLISNDGVHPDTAKEGTVRLGAGWHAIKVRYFESSGQESLKLEWKAPDARDYILLGGEDVRVPKGLTRVTSPGPKLVLGAGGPLRPGNGMPLAGLNPGLDIMTIRPESFKPKCGSVGFLPDGTLLIGTFEPNQGGQFLPELRDGKIYALKGVTGKDRSKITVREVAKDLQEPLGMAVLGKDVYISQRTKISKLVDMDGDGYYEGTQTVGSGWVADNYHHFAFGLVPKDGFLYAALSVSITGGAPGINGPNPPFRGSVFRVDPSKYDPNLPLKNIEFLTSGHRTPNGLVVLPGGEILVAENQGAWQPSNKLNEVIPGHFYGHYNNTTFKTSQHPNGGVPGEFDDRALTRPAVYIPQNEAGNSPSQSVVIPKGKPFAGQLLVGDVKYGGLTRVFLEKVNGRLQGGIVHFTQGFESGINRLTWGPDGSLYMAGIGASETWGWTDPKTGKETTFGLQKVTFNGKKAFEYESIRATPDGFLVTLNKPAANLADPKQWSVRQWNYRPTPEYGGDKFNKERLEVKRAVPGRDGRSVRLVIPGLKEDRIVYLSSELKSKAGESLWSAESWYTLNAIPTSNPTVMKPKTKQLLVFTKTAGFRHDAIEEAQNALRELDPSIQVTVTEDSSVFSPENLRKFDAVAFVLTTGDVLNDAQQEAVEAFVKGGGGFIGVHSASDTEYDWPFYGDMVGAYFKRHPQIQTASIDVIDRIHPTTRLLPKRWTRVDEWYDYRAVPKPDCHILATLDESSYSGGTMGKSHPVMWCHSVGKGRAWYTGRGHTKETWHEALFMGSLKSAIEWVSRTK